jgi:uncharacterized cupredoxin-like copper-binding protein
MGTKRLMVMLLTGALLGACSTTASDSQAPGNTIAAGNSAGAGSSAAAGSSAGPAAAVAATMKEWSITLSPATGASGEVTFTIANNGAFVHEFVVRKTDLAADSLPLNSAGEVDESDPRLEDVGELEDIPAGSTANTLTVTVGLGHYVIFCNLHVGTVLHYQQGLHTDLTIS